MSLYKGIIFDLDGTILDSTKLNIDSFQHAARQHLGKNIDERMLLSMYGKPLTEQVNFFAPGITEAFIESYREYSGHHHDQMLSLFPKVRFILEELKKFELQVCLVTSKGRAGGERNLVYFDILKYFDQLIYFDDVSIHKPNPAPYNLALKRMHLTPNEVISVGDSPFDIIGSKRAGLTTVLVGWTTFHRREFFEQIPDYIIHDFEMLLSVLFQRTYYSIV